MQPVLTSSECRGRRIAFLTTAYPKVSHTFIRREILALEELGWRITRLAIREAGEDLPDPEDRAEDERTRHCLSEPKLALVGTALAVLASRPRAALGALAMTLGMARASERGLLRHLAYLVEACWLVRICEAERVEHVHVHFGTNATAVARLAARLGGPSYSFTVHGPDEFDAPIGLDLAGKIRDAVFVAGISHFCAAQLRRWSSPRDWPNIHVVHCSVAADFRDSPVEELYGDGDAPDAGEEPIARVAPGSRMLLTIGRLSAQKGHRVLLEALARLVAEGRDVSLVLAGDGELRPDVEASIRELGLEKHVRITGWIGGAEVRELLAQCRAMVLPSFAEGLPVVLMEAFALRRTVVSTWVAGTPELVRPGENGWLVPPGDVDALARAMAEVLDASPAQLDALADAGRERVLAEHSDTIEARKLSRLLEAAVERQGAPAGARERA